MEIYFVRHAEKQKNIKNPSLTERGISQAKFLAKNFKKKNFTHFYCSDTNRTKETSKFISEIIGIEPKIENCLNEFDGRILKIKKEGWEKEVSRRYEELLNFLNKITKEKTKEKKILILAHGVTNRLIMATLLELNFKNIIRMAQLNTAVNIAYWVERFNNWRLKSWNNVSHLPEKLSINLDGY